jgi:hypothetical protein
MVFGAKDAVDKALDARDGVEPNMLTNLAMMDAMKTVDTSSLWSILDEKGTQTMMKQVLGEAGAGSVTDFDSVRKRLQSSWYGMDFQHGVKFDLTISTGDTFAAATISSLLTAAVMVRKMSGSDGCGKAGVGRHRHRFRFGQDVDSFCGLGFRFQQPAAFASVPEHGALSS